MSLKKVTSPEKNISVLELHIDKAAFDDAVMKSYKKNVGKMNVPGFRKGKAPKSIIEKMYGAAVFYDDALEMLLPSMYASAVEEAKLEVVSRPEIDIVSIDDGGVELTAKVYTKPVAVVNQYRGLEAAKDTVRVTKAEIEEEIELVRKRNGRQITLEDQPAADGDETVIDFEGFLDGVAFEGGKGEKFPLKLGSGSFIPGFEEQLVGHKAGESFEINVTFPEDYHAENLAGKPVVFKVKVHAITEENVPELNDEFVQDISECSTVDEYTAYVRGDLEKRAAERAKNERTDLILQKVIDNAEVEIHGDIVSAEVDMQIDRFDKQLQSFGADLKSYLEYAHLSIEDMRKDYEQAAQRQLKSQYVMMAIIDAEKLEPTDEDFREVIAMSDTAKQQHWDDEKIDAELKDNRMKYAVSALYNAAVKMLVANAVVPAAAPAEEAPAAE